MEGLSSKEQIDAATDILWSLLADCSKAYPQIENGGWFGAILNAMASACVHTETHPDMFDEIVRSLSMKYKEYWEMRSREGSNG